MNVGCASQCRLVVRTDSCTRVRVFSETRHQPSNLRNTVPKSCSFAHPKRPGLPECLLPRWECSQQSYSTKFYSISNSISERCTTCALSTSTSSRVQFNCYTNTLRSLIAFEHHVEIKQKLCGCCCALSISVHTCATKSNRLRSQTPSPSKSAFF
jgi:hypothetical protein